MFRYMSESFDSFMKTNYNKFMVYCVSRGQNPTDSDEIVSEAFIRLYAKWSERCFFEEQQNKKWMYNAINYIIKEYYRNNKKHEVENIDDYAEFLPDNRIMSGIDVDENLIYTEFIKNIEQRLSESDRKLFHLAYIQDKSYSDICKELNINNQSLRTKISRLKDRIKKILKQ